MEGKIVAICQFGGAFGTNQDGTLSYTGGDAHAIDVDHNMKIEDFKAELITMFACDSNSFIIKYLLPSNRRTLISVSNDKDLQRMVNFSAGSVTIDVFLVSKIGKRPDKIMAIEAAPDLRSIIPAGGDELAFAMPENEIIESGIKRQKVSDGWDKLITGVGQAFDDVKDFRDALHKFAIGKGFMYKFLKNDTTRVTAVCTAKECQWRIHASTTSSKQKVLIKTFNNIHTCEVDFGKDGHRLANQKWVASIIKEKLKETPHYKPRDIASDLHRDYGISLNYTQAWRGKSFAKRELINSSEEEVCSNQLPWFCERIEKTNPGSVAILDTSDDSRFDRLFVAFNASLHGFQHGCRPLVFLDGISLKMSRQWKILTATSVDAENDAFPVAFAIALLENEENWIWFLEQLKTVLSAHPVPITFVSNRQNGLAEAVPQVFEDSYHGLCLSHLLNDYEVQLEELIPEETLTEQVKQELIDNLKQAAYAYKSEEFNGYIESIKVISNEVGQWILENQPELWANASFKGLRHDSLSSSAPDLFNLWLGKVGRQEPTVIQIIDWIRCKLMEMLYMRRESSNAWSDIISPSVNQRLIQEQSSRSSCSLEVIPSTTNNVYEVRESSGITDMDTNADVVNIVNIETWECSCRKWQVSGLPCVHMIGVVERNAEEGGGCLYDYCSKYFRTELYRLTYSESIIPIPDVGRPILVDSPQKYPLRTPRPPGRPKQRPIEPQRIISKRSVQCSKCKEYGHNKSTCKSPQILSLSS